MRKRLGLLAAAAAAMLALSVVAAEHGTHGAAQKFGSAAKFSGSWKSTHDGAHWSDAPFPANFSLTINLKIEGDTLNYYSVNDSNKDRPPRIVKFTAKFDDKVYPIEGSAADARYNQVRLRRVRDDAFELLQLKDGDVIVGGFWELLPDGRLVRWGVGKNEKGVSRSYTEYFKK